MVEFFFLFFDNGLLRWELSSVLRIFGILLRLDIAEPDNQATELAMSNVERILLKKNRKKDN